MILVCKNNKVIAYHDDNQDIINKYPADHEIIKVDIVEFDEDGWPLYPRSGGTNLRTMGNTEQRIADLEAAIATILGGGMGCLNGRKNIFARVVSRRMAEEGRTAKEILAEYPALTAEERQEILAAVVA